MTPIPSRRTSDHCPTDPSKRCELADAAAESAVTKVFAILGVDIDDPKQVKAFQQAIWSAQSFDEAKKYGILVVIGLAATALWGAFASGVKLKIGG